MPQKTDSITSVEESTHRQRRWGCTCGCLTFLLALVLAILGFFYVALKPYPLNKPDRWLGSETIGFGVLRLSSADSGISDLFSFVATRLEERWSRELKENERTAFHSFITLVRQTSDWVFYPPVYLYLEQPSGTTAVRFAGIAQFRHFFGYLVGRSLINSLGLPARTESPSLLVYDLGGQEKQKAVVAVSHLRLMVANDNSLLQSMASAENTRSASTPSERFMTYYGELHADKPAPGEDLGLVLENKDNAIARELENVLKACGQSLAWERIQETMAKYNVAFEDVQGLRLSGDVISADRVKCVATFYVEQPPALKRFAEAAKLLEGLSTPSAQKSPAIFTKIETQAGRNYVSVTLELTGLRTLLGTWIQGGANATGASNLASTKTEESATTQP
ncbi:MAG: hypothetical protein ACP5QZ_02765 [Candidatus Sumerlaeaceae bacterium]